VIREFRPDAVLGTWAYPDAVAVAMLARRAGIPWVAKVHGSDINQYSAALSLRAQIRWALLQASCTLAVSQPLAERLVEIGVPAERVRVQHNGINVQRFRPLEKLMARQRTGLPRDRKIVVYVGNLKVSKGAADLVEAARCMTGAGGGAPLVALVGEGSARERLEKAIAQHSLEDDVRLVGARPHDEIPEWIAAADALCLPSHQEGCPNVVLEALACGRPVVASRVGAVPEFVDDGCGAVVSPREPDQLAAALAAVVAREWDPTALRERVLPLSWEENARVLAGELERAIRERKTALDTPRSQRQDEQVSDTT
jgi:glycosyltransferase involved in cell wall biosynthesis